MKKYYAETDRVMVVFERNLPTKGTLHGHLQVAREGGQEEGIGKRKGE